MNAMEAIAAEEVEAVHRHWQTGGSDRYPASLPTRPRPKQARKEVPAELDCSLPAFDEALEHVNWCRMQGMSPQDVCRSIRSQHLAETWGGAVAILERYIVKMRQKTEGKTSK
jgi:hypothetical protein